MNPKYDRFGRKERIIGPAGVFPAMTCRYADAHCMSENQLQEKRLCGFAALEGTPLQPKRFAAPEEGCRAHGYCNLAISSTGDEREAYTHVGNLATYTHRSQEDLPCEESNPRALCVSDQIANMSARFSFIPS